jgi:hypothetical protein
MGQTQLLTFKDFLRILDEDLDSDIAKLMADISMIDSTIATRNNPLIQQRMRLQKMLAIKQKQKQAEEKKAPQEPTTQGPQAGQTTTPGSTGAATPGSQ